MICFIFFGFAMGLFYIYSAIDEASNLGGVLIYSICFLACFFGLCRPIIIYIKSPFERK